METLAPEHVDALWDKGILWWKLRPIQRLIYSDSEQRHALTEVENCSRRLGKTYLNLIRASETAIQIRGASIPFAAPTGKMLRNIILPMFREICHDAPKDVRPVWRPADSKFVFPRNYSEIRLAGVNNGHADDLRGQKAHRAFIDEAGFIDDLEYLIEDVIRPQLLTTNGRLTLTSSPPRTPAHSFVKYIRRAQKKGTYSEYDISRAGYDPKIIEDFCTEAGGPNSTTWKREFLCQLVVDEKYAIIPEWKPEFEREWPRDIYFPFYTLYAGMDMGVKDKTVILFGYYDFKAAKLIIENELVMFGPDMTTEKLADAFKIMERNLWKDRKVDMAVADNNNPLMLLDLASLHGIHFVPTQKTGRTERTSIIEAMVNDLRINVQSGKIIVHPRCKELIGCLRYGIWEESRRTFARTEEFGHFDALAAMIYLNRFVNWNHNPIPKTFALNSETHFIGPDITKSEHAEAIKKMMNLRKRL